MNIRKSSGMGPASQVAQWLKKKLPTVRETQVKSLGQEDSLEKEMETYLSTLAGEIPWTEEPSGLQSMGSQRVRHDWATKQQACRQHLLSLSLFLFWRERWPWEGELEFGVGWGKMLGSALWRPGLSPWDAVQRPWPLYPLSWQSFPTPRQSSRFLDSGHGLLQAGGSWPPPSYPFFSRRARSYL